jgi:glycosyltransferase involved in cell wall biosynthesis
VRILLITHFFPPYDHIASARTGKTAKYLTQFGHDVRVIAAKKPLTPFANMPVEIPRGRITYTPWLGAIYRADIALNELGKRVTTSVVTTASPGETSVTIRRSYVRRRLRLLHAGKRVRDFLRTFVYFPDAEIGWLPFGILAGRRLIKNWRPDVIMASAGPQTSLLIARTLSRTSNIPWVAELRDLWIDNHQYHHPKWRRWLESGLERRVISSAAGLVTVSEPLAERLREKYKMPVEVVYNGFDPGDHGDIDLPGVNTPFLRIVYTGWVYPQQNVEPLFEALQILGDQASNVRVVFFRSDRALLSELAGKHSVTELVETHDGVDFMTSLSIQRAADVLLYLSWNVENEQGIFSGKLLQYFGARRPILAVGLAENAPARAISDRGIGVALSDPVAISRQIANWLAEKRRRGYIADAPAEAVAEFSRENQTRRLEQFLQSVT